MQPITFLPSTILAILAGAGFLHTGTDPTVRIQADMAYLASDVTRGRGNGSPELEQVATWLAAHHGQAQPSRFLAPGAPAALPNVVATIPGTDQTLRSEYIAIGAHFDHLGLGERHSRAGAAGAGRIHPGADDNASGTCMVLELARTLRKARPRRSILIFHFSGEEDGLLGSGAWIKSPTVPIESVKFYFNFDMVGRMATDRPLLFMTGLGAPVPTLERAKRMAPKGLTIAPEAAERVWLSDHISFAQAKIPTFFFFTGLHADYHRPSDTADKINAKGIAFLTEYAKKLVLDLANGDTVPVFTPETARLQRPVVPFPVSTGLQPDYAEYEFGFRVESVREGSPAAQAGLVAGDFITGLGGVRVQGFFDYLRAILTHTPGESLLFHWTRAGNPMHGTVVLEGPEPSGKPLP